jgi:hypothetical protein
MRKEAKQMKREFLKGLGIDDSLIDQIMSENGKDINNAKASAEAQMNVYKDETEKHKQTNADLLKQYNDLLGATKDYAELKQFKVDTLAKQEESRKVDFLKNQGCKHPELLVSQIDFSKATYDEEKKTYTGLDEVIKAKREAYGDMFEAKGTQDVQNKSLGFDKGSSLLEQYKAEHPELATFLK